MRGPAGVLPAKASHTRKLRVVYGCRRAAVHLGRQSLVERRREGDAVRVPRPPREREREAATRTRARTSCWCGIQRVFEKCELRWATRWDRLQLNSNLSHLYHRQVKLGVPAQRKGARAPAQHKESEQSHHKQRGMATLVTETRHDGRRAPYPSPCCFMADTWRLQCRMRSSMVLTPLHGGCMGAAVDVRSWLSFVFECDDR